MSDIAISFNYSLGISQDGQFGPYTKTQLQRWLKVWKYYTRAIDGDFGYYSTLALQKYLRKRGLYGTNLALDGVFGNGTWAALNKWVSKVATARDDFTTSTCTYWMQRFFNGARGSTYRLKDGRVLTIISYELNYSDN